jgi:hypothetical protein
LGSKFNTRTYDTFESVKLAMNEAIDRFMAIGLGNGITQLDVLSF